MDSRVAYVRLGCTQLELDETNLGLLDSGWATSGCNHGLIENDTIDEFSILDGTAHFLHNSDISEVDV